MRTSVIAVAVAALLAAAAPVRAQTPRNGTLTVTVLDPSGAVVPNATVTIVDRAAGGSAPTLAPVKTNEKGIATFTSLAPGRYTIRAEFEGFAPGVAADARIRAGDNKQAVPLAFQKVEESVTVARDAQAAAADPKGGSFTTVLTKEQIESLSDDPAELMQQLLDLAGGNAVISVDSFLGAPLPPKAQIKSIHIVRDAFAAENHSAESDEIEIITQPGVGPLRGGFSSRIRDGSMSARSPFTSTRGPERTQSYDVNVGGTLIKNKSSFSLSVGGRDAFDTPVINVALPDGARSEVLGVRRPSDNWSMYGLFDYALTRDQMLRIGYDQSISSSKNLGIGGYDLVERAYARESRDFELRVQETGPIGRRLFVNTRLDLNWTSSRSKSVTEAPTFRVNDGFTQGGAQVAGGRRNRIFELASDLDYVRGMHTVRTGVLLSGGHYRSDDASNYLGTYVFSSTDDFVAGRPRTYTRRIGDPLVQYWNVLGAVYLQDDIRVSKSLTFSPGVRYEAQMHVRDFDSIGPRFGLTWAPFKSGKTTLRASWGLFYNWLGTGTYEQTLRVDGFRQREVFIVNPSYPDPGTIGTISTANRYLLGPEVAMGRTMRVSAGIDQRISPTVRFNATYSANRATDLLNGRNLNPLANGVRPDPAFANVIEVESDARSTSHQIATTMNVSLAPPSRALSAPRVNWRRTSFRMSYWLAKAKNNSEGAFTVPASGTLDTEWAAASGDRRHRITGSINTTALKNLSANVSVNANSGTPFTITTGTDDNSDSFFNDRPAGGVRNGVRTPWQYTWNGNVSYSIPFGPPPTASMQDHSHAVAPSQPGRYRLSFNVSVVNLTNRANYTGFSGVMTSRFFLQPTAVSNPRKVDVSMSLRF